MKYLFNSKKQFYMPNSGISAYEINNFSIKNNDSETIILPGTYLPVRFGVHYGHLLIDFLGGYYQLKKIYPDLKLIFWKEELHLKTFSSANACLDIANILSAEIIDTKNNNYIFENIVIMNLDVPAIPINLISDGSDYIPEHKDEVKKWYLESIKEIKLNLSHLKIKNNVYEKIYASRSKVNKYHKDSHEWNTINRYHNEIYDETLDNKLEELGYKVLDLYGMSLLDQINIFYNAKTIVGIDGASLINCIWADESATVYKILLNKNFNFYYDDIIKQAGINNIITIDATDSNIDLIVNSLK